jgi:putative Mg2+ transporter-C (MgtC) family protein
VRRPNCISRRAHRRISFVNSGTAASRLSLRFVLKIRLPRWAARNFREGQANSLLSRAGEAYDARDGGSNRKSRINAFGSRHAVRRTRLEELPLLNSWRETTMLTSLTWHSIAIRLIFDIIAASVIGIDRDEHGRPAGLRTNLLVSLAACIAMIQTNLLIHSTGKTADSFVVMDVMRLPLGILSGIGFIGAGAIIRRGDLVVGLTTAATLWFVTVMGLCFGGGQIGLGVAAFVLGFAILAGLKRVEPRIPQEHRGVLTVSVANGGPEDTEIESLLRKGGLAIESYSIKYTGDKQRAKTFIWQVRWKSRRKDIAPPPIIRDFTRNAEIQSLEFDNVGN